MGKGEREHLDSLPRSRSFGNARLARQLLEQMMTRQAARLGGLPQPDVETPAKPEDLPFLTAATAERPV
ncbi:hypothetical protein ABZ608_39945 [Streptomyces sp. NPDC013172]|uniref:hypothetical protein n=1 Tax=Streptomyces sp. NPDC013172 TaxID=3155009 RepID=UPI0033F6ED5E